MVLRKELGPKASKALASLKTFSLIVGLVVPSLVIGYYYGVASNASSLARFVSCMDANVPGCKDQSFIPNDLVEIAPGRFTEREKVLIDDKNKVVGFCHFSDENKEFYCSLGDFNIAFVPMAIDGGIE